jgi:hypothetical protein
VPEFATEPGFPRSLDKNEVEDRKVVDKVEIKSGIQAPRDT